MVGYNKVHKYSHHRIRIGLCDPFIKSSPIVSNRDLPTSPLYSFLWLSHGVPDYSFQFIECFKLLTVLNLNVESTARKFPKVIFSMIYLRYLKFRSRWIFKAVPPKIANMCKLETLIIDPSLFLNSSIWLPECMWDMKCLRHVHIKDGRVSLKDSDQNYSANLLGGASNIQRLGVIRLNVDNSTTSEFLQRFPHLRKLSCNITGHILKLLSMAGSQLPNLKSLRVSCEESSSSEAQNLKICNLIRFNTMENLYKLSLHAISVPWSVLSEIGKLLPNLHVLKLLQGACSGKTWEVKDGGFSKLIYLKLYRLDIEEIDVLSCEDNPFPCLEHLVVDQCSNLKELPCVLEEISTLKTIKVRHCRKEVEDSAMEILEQQRDYGNGSLQVTVKYSKLMSIDKLSEEFE